MTSTEKARALVAEMFEGDGTILNNHWKETLIERIAAAIDAGKGACADCRFWRPPVQPGRSGICALTDENDAALPTYGLPLSSVVSLGFGREAEGRLGTLADFGCVQWEPNP